MSIEKPHTVHPAQTSSSKNYQDPSENPQGLAPGSYEGTLEESNPSSDLGDSYAPGSEMPPLTANDVRQEVYNALRLARANHADQDVIRQLESELGEVNHSVVLDTQKQQEALQQIMGEIGNLSNMVFAKPGVSPSGEGDTDQSLKTQIDELKSKISDSDLSGIDKQDLQDLLSQASDALKKNQSDEAGTLLQQAQDQFDSGIQDLKDDKKKNITDKKSDLETLNKKVKDSKLTDDAKKTFKDKIDALEKDIDAGNVTGKDIDSKVEDLTKEVNKALKTEDLKSVFTGFASKVVNDGYGYTKTVELASLVEKAIASGSWQSVDNYLADLKKDHGQEADNAIRQLVGTIFYTLAGGDEKKLDQILDLIPAQTRNNMISCCHNGEETQNDYSENEEKKKKYGYYGTGQVTADRLDQSTKKDDIEGSPDSGSDPKS